MAASLYVYVYGEYVHFLLLAQFTGKPESIAIKYIDRNESKVNVYN